MFCGIPLGMCLLYILLLMKIAIVVGRDVFLLDVDVTLLGLFLFLLPLIPVLLLHLSHACVALRLLGLASSFPIAPVLLFSWR